MASRVTFDHNETNSAWITYEEIEHEGNGGSNLNQTKQNADAQMMGGNETGMMKSGVRMMKMGSNII